MEDVRDPAVWLSMRFDSLEEAVREAKRATFTYLQLKRHKNMPDQIDWRIMDETHGQRHRRTDPTPPKRDVPDCAGADGVITLDMHETVHREALMQTDLKAGLGHSTRYR